jgi:hypothetical protein
LSEFKNAKVDIIYIVKSDTNVDLKDCSYYIQYKLSLKRETNTIYSRIFKAGEDDTAVKKRMGLYLERKLETSIVEVVKNTLLSENNSEVNHSTNKSVHRRKNGHVDHHHEYEEKDKSILGEIICQLHHNSPDNCEMNELKVLLERLSYIVTFLYIICNREKLRRNQFVSLNFAKPFPCIILVKGLVRS